MTGDSGQTGEGGVVQEEMEEGQQMESSIEGGRNVERNKTNRSNGRDMRRGDEMEKWMIEQN